jgi:hypothetical protein
VSFCHQRGFTIPTAVSRLDLLHALISRRTLKIDRYQANTPDKSWKNGHFYSDKAPGTVVLALPSFYAAAVFLRLVGVSPESEVGWLATSWVASAASNGLLAACGAAAAFAWLQRWVSSRSALLSTLAIFLGAAPLPYATMMFSHTLVVGLIAIALWAVVSQADREVWSVQCGFRAWVKANRWNLLAGHAYGWALASEYTAGLAVLGLFVFLFLRSWRRAIPFSIVALPPLLLIPAYSFACFGTPLTLSYSLSESFPAMKEGLYAIKWPHPGNAANLLFMPTRGLFFWSPFLVMAFFGFRELAGRSPRAFWLAYAVPALQITVISGRTWDWQAGPTLGPRYLAPVLPFLALPCALGNQRFPKLGMALAVYSIGITMLATLTSACPDPSIYNPLLDLDIPLFLRGQFSPNLGTVLGLPPFLSVALFSGTLLVGIVWLWKQLPLTNGASVLKGCQSSRCHQYATQNDRNGSAVDSLRRPMKDIQAKLPNP